MSHHLIGVGYIISFLVERKNLILIGEWNDLCKCQLKPSSLTDIPFLVRTSALLDHIMPVVSDHH